MEKVKFLKNTFENIEIEDGSILKSIILQKTKSNGYFYKNTYLDPKNIIQVIKILFLAQV